MKIRHSERLCLRGVAQGKSYKRIADELHIKPRSVAQKLTDCKRRNGCRTTFQLLFNLGVENQWLF